MCQDIEFPIVFFFKKDTSLGPDASFMTNDSCIHTCIF